MTLELLASTVDAMEKSKSEWEGLCREMLTTITMDGNKEVFAVLPETWHSIVSAWVNKFHEIEAVEQRVQPTPPTEPKNFCNPVNGVHASWCTGHNTAGG